MSPIKRLSGSISVLALSVALGGAANASAPVAGDDVARTGLPGITNTAVPSDLLVDVILRSDGQLTAQSLEAILPVILKPLSPERARALPDLMSNIRGVGVGSDVQTAALKSLTGLIAEASGKSLDRELATRLVAEVKDRFGQKIHYAKVQNNPGTGKANQRGKDRNNNDGRGNGTYSG